MKQTLFFTVLLLLQIPIFAQSTQQERLTKHVYFLADDSLHGRSAGTADSYKAAQYIIGQYEEMGAQSLISTYFIEFPIDPKSEMVKKLTSGTDYINSDTYKNIAIIIRGSDPILSKDYILVGAHYDHIGMKGSEVCNGADDNASGTAAVIELARNLIARQGELKRSVVIANFDAEEVGLVGSGDLAEKLMRLKTISNFGECQLMMSIDMVGWLRQSGVLHLEGSSTIRHGGSFIREIAEQCQMPIKLKRFENSILTATDTEPFAKNGIPTLAVTTGLKSPYHKPEDDADLIDYPGLSHVVDFLTELTINASKDPEFKGSGRVAYKHGASYPAIEMGLNLGGGRNWLDFPQSAVESHLGWGFSGGADLLVNFGQKQHKHSYFSLRTGALYDQFSSPFPDTANLFTHSLKMRQQAIEIPAVIRFSFHEGMTGFFVGIGGFYDYMLRQSNTINTDPIYGILWEFGMRAGRWEIGANFHYQLPGSDALQSQYNTRGFINYYLW